MGVDEIDSVLAAKVKQSVAEKLLPEEFAGRLCASLKRSRRIKHLLVGTILAIAALVATFATSMLQLRARNSIGQTAIASQCPRQDETLSRLMLLGMFRECFRRTRTARRREGEER